MKLEQLILKSKVKMRFNYFFLFFLFFSLFFISGCGTQEVQKITCPSDSTYLKYTYHTDTNTCSKTIIPKDKCGNGVAEPKTNNENFCNCPADIHDVKLAIDKGGCSGNKGDYLKYYCNANTNTCDTKITNAVKKVPAKLLTLSDGGYFSFETQVDYYKPFILDKQKIKLSFMLKNFMDTDTLKVTNINLRKIYIITDSNEILGQKILNKKFEKKYDSYILDLPLTGFTLDSFTKNYNGINLKILVSYTKNTYNNKGELFKSEEEVFETKSKFEKVLTLLDSRNKNIEEKKVSTWG